MNIIILVVLISVFFSTVVSTALNTGVAKSSIHTPTESERKRWEDIESILLKKDAKTVGEIDGLLSELAKEENNVTSLLEQKASTQMGCISIVVTIVLAAFSFYTKDLYLLKKGNICLSLLFVVSIAFLITAFFSSIYFSYQGFKIREDFASYNIDDLFDIMKDKDSGLVTFQISNILENYQVCAINSVVNEEKADALNWAARFFIFGIAWFFATLLIVICIISSRSAPQKEVT
jgi:hypothetical protein